MFCINCGKQIDDNMKFCIYCGARQDVEDPVPEEDEAAKIAAQKAEEERLAAQRAEAERARIEAERAEAARIAAQKAEEERLAAQRAEAEKARIEAEQAEAARIAAQKAEEERLAAQRAEAEKARIEAEQAEAAKIAAQDEEKKAKKEKKEKEPKPQKTPKEKTPKEKPEKKEGENKKKPVIGIILGIIALAIIGGIAYYVITTYMNPSDDLDDDETTEVVTESVEVPEMEEINSDKEEVTTEQPATSEEAVTEVVESEPEPEIPAQEQKGLYSLWFDGIEFRVLEELDNNQLLVKFRLGEMIIQTIVAKDIMDDVKCAYWINARGKNASAYLLIAGQGENDYAYAFAYGPASYEEMEGSLGNDAVSFTNEIGQKGMALKYENTNFDEVFYSLGNDKTIKGSGYYSFVYDDVNAQVLDLYYLCGETEQVADLENAVKNTIIKRAQESDLMTITDKEYNSKMADVFIRYQEMGTHPDDILKEICMANGQDYVANAIWDINNDEINEIIYFGSPQSICIVGQYDGICISGEEMYFSNEAGVFYTLHNEAGVEIWTKYCLNVMENGKFRLDCLQEEYLKKENNSYYKEGAETTEETYLAEVKDLKRHDKPQPKILYNYAVGEVSFYDASRRIIGEPITSAFN